MGEQIAGAILPSLLGGLMGAGEPTYQQPSMDQILTPAQKALQQDLIDIGKLGSKWGKEYFNEDRFNQNKAAYNATMNRLQGNPPATALSATTITPPTSQNTSSFAVDDKLEQAAKYMDLIKGSPQGIGGTGTYQAQMRFMTDPATRPIYQEIAQGKITPEMLEAYKRQKQQAMDAQLLSGVK